MDQKKNDDAILTSEEEAEEEYVSIESTGYWREMAKNRVGNLLAGVRLKAGLTQAQLAEKLNIRQNMVSDYERGRRMYSKAMARRLGKVLKVKEERPRYGSGKDETGSESAEPGSKVHRLNILVSQVRTQSHRHPAIPIRSCLSATIQLSHPWISRSRLKFQGG